MIISGNLSVHEAFEAQLDRLLSDELSRFSDTSPVWKCTCQTRTETNMGLTIKDE
jgi:hypothetical protein